MTVDHNELVVGVDEARRRLPEYLSGLENRAQDEIRIGAYRRIQGALISAEALEELHQFRDLKRRAREAESALASIRAEGLEPSEAGRAEAEAYVAGAATIDDLIKRAITRHRRA